MFRCSSRAIRARRRPTRPSAPCATSSTTLQPPPGVKAYVTGAAPLISDQFDVGSKGTAKVTGITVGVIALMLFFVYRSILTTLLVLVTVLIEMSARPRNRRLPRAMPGSSGCRRTRRIILTLLVIAAGTDYAIFFVGRYQEARGAGEDREKAFYTMFHGTAHIVLGSGLTVAGAVACLSFTRLPYFQSLGIPAALGILVALVGALTLGPAMLTLGALVGVFEPKRAMRTRGWRRIGTAIVRWPGPVLVCGVRVGPGGSARAARIQDQLRHPPLHARQRAGQCRLHGRRAAFFPRPAGARTADGRGGSRPARPGRHADPGPGGQGGVSRARHRAGADHHQAVGNAARAQLARVRGQQFTAPPSRKTCTYQRDRANDLQRQAGELAKTINILKQQYVLQQQLAAATHSEAQSFHDTIATIKDLRDKIANFDDFFRPIRSYFYWEKHCYDIPACFALRSTFDALDSIDQLTREIRRPHRNAGQTRCAAAETGGADTAPDRQPGDQSRTDPGQLRHPVRHQRPDGRPRSTTRRRWGEPLTPPRTTTPSTCRPRFSTTPISSAA